MPAIRVHPVPLTDGIRARLRLPWTRKTMIIKCRPRPVLLGIPVRDARHTPTDGLFRRLGCSSCATSTPPALRATGNGGRGIGGISTATGWTIRSAVPVEGGRSQPTHATGLRSPRQGGRIVTTIVTPGGGPARGAAGPGIPEPVPGPDIPGPGPAPDTPGHGPGPDIPDPLPGPDLPPPVPGPARSGRGHGHGHGHGQQH